MKIILTSAIITILVAGLVIPSIAFADVISPVKQMKLNFSTDEVASIDDLEKKVTDLQEKIRMEKEKLANLVQQSSKAQGYEKQVNELTDKIVMLRTDLNAAKANLFKLLSTK